MFGNPFDSDDLNICQIWAKLMNGKVHSYLQKNKNFIFKMTFSSDLGNILFPLLLALSSFGDAVYFHRSNQCPIRLRSLMPSDKVTQHKDQRRLTQMSCQLLTWHGHQTLSTSAV